MPHVDRIPPGPDTLRILITTDNHVGYNENDPIRSDDSWLTFQEITYLAKSQDVDMILQGGDLFHVNKPSKKSMYHVMRSLRLNCMGNRPCELELLSDPAQAGGLGDGGFDTVNYEDPNLNVSVPVFAISGNHDDATGEGLLSPMDLLSVAGLVNHFGKVPNNDNITISPMLFQKGSTKLSLYGLANVRDERLFKTFRDGKVKFLRANVAKDDWFNLMVVHQNHAAHTDTSYLPESFLPDFLDLVVWGHEHECIPYPVHNSERGFETLQPGSSVATSLCEGEAKEKCVFVLNVKGGDYSLETIPLKTVRPFVMEEVSLKAEGILPGPASKEDIISFLTERIEELIERANKMWIESNREEDDEDDEDDEEEDVEEDKTKSKAPLPLIRLRVEYSGGYEVGNPQRFSNRFVGKVANTNDVVQFYKKRSGGTTSSTGKGATVKYDEKLSEELETISAEVKVQQLMNEFLQQTELSLLPEDGLNNAVATFLNQEDKTILKKYIDKEMASETQLLLDVNIDYEDLENGGGNIVKNVLKEIKREGQRKGIKDSASVSWDRRGVVPPKKPRSKTISPIVSSEEDDDENDESEIEILSDEPEVKPKPVSRSKRPSARTVSKTTSGPAERVRAAAPKAKPQTTVRKPRVPAKPKAPPKGGARSILDDLMDI
ncbi:double-strand break repair protein Mre11p [[Candida] anglica]